MLSNQEAFTKVVRHLRKQGKLSTRGGICQYRAPDGSMCAIGCLIPDEKYEPRMEGKAVSSLLYEFPHLQEYLPEPLFCGPLQSIHDQANPPKWEQVFRNVAEAYSLTLEPL